MRPQKQLFGHNPDDDIWGDCYRTSVAIIMDMDAVDVPHFCEEGKNGGDESVIWLKQFGLTQFTLYYDPNTTLDQILHANKVLNPGVPFILTAEGPRGCNHSVVCLDGEIVCDPYNGKPNPEALIGPAQGPEGDCYWWVEVIAKGTSNES